MQIEKLPIALNDGFFHGWPDVALLGDGQSLLCVYNECWEHCDRRHSRIMMLRSNDFGRNWGVPVPLTPSSEGKEMYYNCPRIQRLADGRLVLVFDTLPLKPGKKLHEEVDDVRKGAVLMAFSSDEGITWSPLKQVPIHGIVPSQVLVTHTGRWILGAHRPIEGGKLAQYIIVSDDGGESWSEERLIAMHPDYALCEVSFVETPDGTIVALMRENSFTGEDCMKVISRDDGETWGPLGRLPIPGCHRPVVGALKDGRYLITYRFLQGGRFAQQNFFGALTDAASLCAPTRKEAGVRIFPIDWDSSERGDLGYSGWVQNADGEVFVITYIHDGAPKAQLRGYSIRF